MDYNEKITLTTRSLGTKVSPMPSTRDVDVPTVLEEDTRVGYWFVLLTTSDNELPPVNQPRTTNLKCFKALGCLWTPKRSSMPPTFLR